MIDLIGNQYDDYVSGYIDIFNSPSSIRPDMPGSTVYCITSTYHKVLVVIPLSQTFYYNVLRLINDASFEEVYIVAPDIGISFISDYYLLWDYIKHKQGLKCKILSRYLPKDMSVEEFATDFMRNPNSRWVVNFNGEFNTTCVTIQLQPNIQHSDAPLSCDVYLEVADKRILFINEVNERNAKTCCCNYDKFDELHIPYIHGPYHTLSYHDVIVQHPKMISKIVTNNFNSKEEYNYARSRAVTTGRLAYHDFVQKIPTN